MATYVALFRGINVGKAKRVAMADLRAVFEDLGYGEVKTLLQSGNVVFTAPGKLPSKAADQIEAELRRHSGVQSSVLVIAGKEFAGIAAANPLVDIAADPSRLMVIFMSEPPKKSRIEFPDPAQLAPEVLAIGSKAMYQWCPDGIVASKVPASFWKQLEPVVTARNWRTVTKLTDLVQSLSG